MICSAPSSVGKSLLSGEGEVNNKDDDGLSDDFNVRTRPPTRGEASRIITFNTLCLQYVGSIKSCRSCANDDDINIIRN